jgi:hypothetical protein
MAPLELTGQPLPAGLATDTVVDTRGIDLVVVLLEEAEALATPYSEDPR